MPQEIELKLRLDPNQADTFPLHPLLNARDSETRSFHATYYDTEEGLLAGQKIGLRVRREGDRWVQAMKTANPAQGGLHARQEWEWPLATRELDTSLLPEQPFSGLPMSLKKLTPRLRPLFTTAFRRTTWTLRPRRGCVVECCLDLGEITADQGQDPICEVELELKKGQPSILFALALELMENQPFALETRSKAQRGHALRRPTVPRPRKAEEAKPRKKQRLEDAMVAILHACKGQMLDNIEAAHHGVDPEGAHQMRVGLRRLRSALSLFKCYLPLATQSAWREDLHWVGQTLGPARDWDVFAENLEGMGQHLPPTPGLETGRLQVEGLRARHYAAVRRMLDSARFARFTLRLELWIAQRQWREGLSPEKRAALDAPVIDFARERLAARHRRLRKQGRNLLDLPPEERHRARIEGKKMAYGARFFQALFPARAAKPYVQALSVLRDDLGVLNDGETASRLLDELGLPAHAPLRHAVNGWFAAIRRDHFSRLESSWNRFLDTPVFWE